MADRIHTDMSVGRSGGARLLRDVRAASLLPQRVRAKPVDSPRTFW